MTDAHGHTGTWNMCDGRVYNWETERKHNMKMWLHLLSHSGELEDVESLVIHGGALVDVDDHADFASPAEEALQVVGQLALPVWDMLKQSEGGNSQTGRSEYITLPYLQTS